MNLTARERQALRSLESGLAESDPDLIATMAKLARLMVDEDRPAAEPSRRGWRLVVVSALVRWLPRSRRRGHFRTQSRWVSAMLALWLVVSCAMIATAAALSHVTSSRACAAQVPVPCGIRSPVSPAQPAAR
jgi:hypothetical protein